jgi:hypothetical protein
LLLSLKMLVLLLIDKTRGRGIFVLLTEGLANKE